MSWRKSWGSSTARPLNEQQRSKDAKLKGSLLYGRRMDRSNVTRHKLLSSAFVTLLFDCSFLADASFGLRTLDFEQLHAPPASRTSFLLGRDGIVVSHGA